MSLAQTEFLVLRQTIATRGTLRMILLPAVIFAWAVIAVVLVLFSDVPAAALLSLAVLAAGFEAIHALHVGVERIGRYVQVFYESGSDGPRWETTVMAIGPALPGSGVDPLFSVMLAAATFVNLFVTALPDPTWIELGVIGGFHLAVLIRVIRARGAAARQRALELDNFRAIKSGQWVSKS